MPSESRTQRTGFTLIELMLAVAIFGVIATMVTCAIRRYELSRLPTGPGGRPHLHPEEESRSPHVAKAEEGKVGDGKERVGHRRLPGAAGNFRPPASIYRTDEEPLVPPNVRRIDTVSGGEGVPSEQEEMERRSQERLGSLAEKIAVAKDLLADSENDTWLKIDQANVEKLQSEWQAEWHLREASRSRRRGDSQTEREHLAQAGLKLAEAELQDAVANAEFAKLETERAKERFDRSQREVSRVKRLLDNARQEMEQAKKIFDQFGSERVKKRYERFRELVGELEERLKNAQRQSEEEKKKLEEAESFQREKERIVNEKTNEVSTASQLADEAHAYGTCAIDPGGGFLLETGPIGFGEAHGDTSFNDWDASGDHTLGFGIGSTNWWMGSGSCLINDDTEVIVCGDLESAANEAIDALGLVREELNLLPERITPGGIPSTVFELETYLQRQQDLLQIEDLDNPDNSLNQAIKTARDKIQRLRDLAKDARQAGLAVNDEFIEQLSAHLDRAEQALNNVRTYRDGLPQAISEVAQAADAEFVAHADRVEEHLRNLNRPWWQQGLVAVDSATDALFDALLVEPAKQVWDVGQELSYLNHALVIHPMLDAVGIEPATKLEDFRPQHLSGTGRFVAASDSGYNGYTAIDDVYVDTLTTYWGMGKEAVVGIAQTPERLRAAAWRGDAKTFGYQGAQSYLIARDLAGPTTAGLNLGVSAIGGVGHRIGGRFGDFLVGFRHDVRTLQVQSLTPEAKQDLLRTTSQYRPEGTSEWNPDLVTIRYKDIGETPSTLGHYRDGIIEIHESAWSRAPFGTDAYHVVYHELFHDVQSTYYPKWFADAAGLPKKYPDSLKAHEFTQAPYFGHEQPIPGAHTFTTKTAPLTWGEVSLALSPVVLNQSLSGFDPRVPFTIARNDTHSSLAGPAFVPLSAYWDREAILLADLDPFGQQVGMLDVGFGGDRDGYVIPFGQSGNPGGELGRAGGRLGYRLGSPGGFGVKPNYSASFGIGPGTCPFDDVPDCPVAVEDDCVDSVGCDREPLFRLRSPQSPLDADQWGLFRIGLTPKRHAQLLVGLDSDGEKARSSARSRAMHHLQCLLQQRGSKLSRDFRVYLAEEKHLNAGDKAVLAGQASDFDRGLRKTIPLVDSVRTNEQPTSAPIVAVIDTGVDLAHPELWGQLWRNPGELPGNGIDDDGNGLIDDVFGYNFADNNANVQDDCGHGAHVAGIIAARHDGRGIAGVNPHVRIMVLKAANAQGRLTPLAMCQAIHYAVRNGARIINLSVSGETQTELQKFMIQWALKQGVLIVASSGSKGKDTTKLAPAGLPGVLTVGGSTRNDKRLPGSGWGARLDLVAPGGDILSLRAAGTDFLATLNGADPRRSFSGAIVSKHWYRAGGTSFAAPFVSGVASLLWQKNSKLSAEQIKRKLIMSCDDLDQPGWDVKTGAGRLNAVRALKADPDHFLHVQIRKVKVSRYRDAPALEVRGQAFGTHFRTYRLKLAHGKNPDKDAWVTISNSQKAVPEGVLAYVPGRRFTRPGTWSIRCVAEDIRGTERQATVTIQIK